MSGADGGDGLVVNLAPEQVCWFVDNTSLNGADKSAATNCGRNDDVISELTIRSTAESFRPGVKAGTSTAMILCPADPETGKAALFAGAYRKATSYAAGEKQTRMARAISERCRDILDMKGRPIKWGDVLDACFWGSTHFLVHTRV
ncbi:unnamed protein product [Sphacelaria rigidula]